MNPIIVCLVVLCVLIFAFGWDVVMAIRPLNKKVKELEYSLSDIERHKIPVCDATGRCIELPLYQILHRLIAEAGLEPESRKAPGLVKVTKTGRKK